MVWLFLWIVCMLLAASISSGKGNGGAAGCLIGALLGPIGVLIVAVLGANQQTIEQRQIASGEMRKCVKCAEPIRRDALVCRFCGQQYEMTAPAATSTKEWPSIIKGQD